MGAAEGLPGAIEAGMGATGAPVPTASIAGIENTGESIAPAAATGGTNPVSSGTSTEGNTVPGAAPRVLPTEGTMAMGGTVMSGRKGRKAARLIAPGLLGWK
jgi:hypothetical protein